MLSQHSRYALKALLHLATCPPGAPQPIIGIAAAANVPRKFLEAILVALKKDGIVASMRGRQGGYILARAPGQISFGEVIRATEGPLALIRCASRTAYRPCDDCPDEAACALHRVMVEARDQIAAVLDGRTLAEAANPGAGAGSRPEL